MGIEHGDMVRVTSRRGTLETRRPGLRAGVVFMTLHFPDDVATNLLTINATDPRSGTAEFKACAVRVEPAKHVILSEAKDPRTARMKTAAAGDD